MRLALEAEDRPDIRQKLRSIRHGDVLLLHLCELLLHLRVEFLLGSLQRLRGFRYARFNTLAPGQSHTDREHLVVAVAATRLLKHIADVEIRLALTLRRLELRILLVDTRSVHRDGRVMSENEVLQFVGGTLQWGQRKRFWNDVRRGLRPMQQLLEAGLKLPHLLMVHGDFTQNLRMLDLRF